MSRRGQRELTLDGLVFGEAEVVVPEHADISPQFAAGGDERRWLLQDALDELWDEWNESTPTQRERLWPGNNRGPEFTLILEPGDPTLVEEVVPTDYRDVRKWSLHAGHKAYHKQPVPFVRRDGSGGYVAGSISIMLVGTADKPILARAYPGDCVPPLPWMGSAKYAEGGVAACLKYWRHHAYLYDRRVMEGFVSDTAPLWYTDFGRYKANGAERAKRSRVSRGGHGRR